MSRSGNIVLTVPARGVFHEGTLDGTIFPGMAAEIVPGGDVIGGRPTWRAFSAVDATRSLTAIVTFDGLQGRSKDDEYQDGDRVFLYCPQPGEEINVRVDSPIGTGTSANIQPGTLLRKGQGGMFEVTATASEAVFVVSEDFVDDNEAGTENGTVQAIFIGS